MDIKINRQGKFDIDGVSAPAVGLGTYPNVGQECYQAVKTALNAGYYLIDTATFYRNFEPIGKAVSSQRESAYLISKVWPESQTEQGIKEDFIHTLRTLKTDYLDCYQIHWPNSSIPIEETLGAMQNLRALGQVRHLGISNPTCNHLKRALEVGVPIDWVQVEMHPAFYDPELLEFCRKHHIGVQAWAPLGRGRLRGNQLLEKISKNYGKTVFQVALKWINQNGCIPPPGSHNPAHIQENLNIADFHLNKEEMKLINDQARRGSRECYQGLDEFDLSYEQCWPKG